MKSSYQAVIFDLDGTLANTLNSIAYFANRALAHHQLPEISVDKYRFLVGRGARNLVKGMLDEVGVHDDDTIIENVYSMYNKSYDDNFSYLTEEYAGISDMLTVIKSCGLKIGILSNKPHNTTIKLSDKLFHDKIDLCYGYRDGYERKPSPSVLLSMIAEFDTTPNRCIYVGDTSTDMRTGKSAGAYTVGVTWGFRDRKELEEHDADLIIDSPEELVKLLLA